MSEQRCGNCGWWKRWAPVENVDGSFSPIEWGDCEFPLPDSAGNLRETNEIEGADCPCHKPKEEEK